MKKSFEKGFTLIELLIVIAIIGILAVIGLNSFNSARMRARDTLRIAAMDYSSKALFQYSLDQGGIYPAATTFDALFGSPTATLRANGLAERDIIPQQPSDQYQYCVSADQREFKVRTNLENESNKALVLEDGDMWYRSGSGGMDNVTMTCN